MLSVGAKKMLSVPGGQRELVDRHPIEEVGCGGSDPQLACRVRAGLECKDAATYPDVVGDGDREYALIGADINEDVSPFEVSCEKR